MPTPAPETDDGTLPTDAVAVRTLEQRDLAAIVRIDAASMGRRREEYYAAKVKSALGEGRLQTSVVAEVDGNVVGFCLAKVFYGEFGQAEPVAVIDSVGVLPSHRGQHVGAALLRQLLMNLRALGVVHVQTEVDWKQFDLLRFLAAHGFRPAPRLCLELDLGDGPR